MQVIEIFASVQGEGRFIGTPSTFVRFAGCNLRCVYCIAGDTLVLKSDFSRVPMRELRIGDELLGVQRPDAPGAHQRFVLTSVTHKVSRGRRPVVQCGALKATFEHKVWHKTWWRDLGTMKLGAPLTQLPLESRDPELDACWLAGVFDGDGWFYDSRPKGRYHVQAAVAAKDPEMVDAVIQIGRRYGFHFRLGVHKSTSWGVAREHPIASLTIQKEFDELRSFVAAHRWGLGYLAGIVDSEGSWAKSSTLRIHQKNPEVLSHIKRVLAEEHFAYGDYERKGVHQLAIRGGLREALRLLLNSNVVIERKRLGFLNYGLKSFVVPLEELPAAAGVADVYDIATTTGNFFAGGVLVKNCDTKYAWDSKAGQEMTPAEIVSEVRDRERQHVVLTGGEPLAQPYEELTELARLLVYQDRLITIETNATIKPPLQLTRYVYLWSLSPKLSSAKLQDPPDWKALVAYIAYAALCNKIQVKFVIANEQDILEAAEYARTARGLHYILQPEGYAAYDGATRAEAVAYSMDVYRRLVALAREHFPIDEVSVQILPQLHVLTWGHQRGV